MGKLGFNRSKKEGDFTTPIGVFSLGTLYFRKDRIKFKKEKKIKENDDYEDNLEELIKTTYLEKEKSIDLMPL